MGTNIKQSETPRRIRECEAVQTLCKILLLYPEFFASHS